MQTFLPYESFRESAKVLDWRRLGKQRVEGMQIINAIEGKTNIECFNVWVNELKRIIIYIITQECGLLVFGFLL